MAQAPKKKVAPEDAPLTPAEQAQLAFYRQRSASLRGSNTSTEVGTKKKADPLTQPGVPQAGPPITGLDFIDRILYGLQGKDVR